MTAIAYLDESASGWDRTLYAFLAEKHRRSGSLRTVQHPPEKGPARCHASLPPIAARFDRDVNAAPRK